MKPIYFLLPNNLAERTSLQQFGFLLLFLSASLLFYNLLAPLLVMLAGHSLTLLSDPNLSSLSPNEMLLLKLFQGGASLFVFVFPSLLFGYLMHQSGSKDYLQMQAIPLPDHFGKVLVTIPLCLPIIVFLAGINHGLTLPSFLQTIDDWMREMESQSAKMIFVFLKMDHIGQLLLNLIIMAVLPALGEELLFRGCIQQIWQRALQSPHLAIWLTGALFSFIHLQFFGFLPRMAIGIVLGYLFYYSRNLWLPILTHFLYNGAQVYWTYLYPLKSAPTSFKADDPFQDMPYGVLTLIPFVFLSVGILWYLLPSFRQQISINTSVNSNLNADDSYPSTS